MDAPTATGCVIACILARSRAREFGKQALKVERVSVEQLISSELSATGTV